MPAAPIRIEPFEADTPPLRVEKSGAVRVGMTRVSLEVVLHAFLDGQTPETIAQNYDTLALAEVYAVIAYYLRHKARLDAWLSQQDEEAAEVERDIREKNADLGDIRARLLARRKP